MEGGADQWREGQTNGGRGRPMEGGADQWREGQTNGGRRVKGHMQSPDNPSPW